MSVFTIHPGLAKVIPLPGPRVKITRILGLLPQILNSTLLMLTLYGL